MPAILVGDLEVLCLLFGRCEVRRWWFAVAVVFVRFFICFFSFGRVFFPGDLL